MGGTIQISSLQVDQRKPGTPKDTPGVRPLVRGLGIRELALRDALPRAGHRSGRLKWCKGIKDPAFFLVALFHNFKRFKNNEKKISITFFKKLKSGEGKSWVHNINHSEVFLINMLRLAESW